MYSAIIVSPLKEVLSGSRRPGAQATLPVEPPTDTDIADVVRRSAIGSIRKLHHLGYLEAGIDAAVATIRWSITRLREQLPQPFPPTL